MQRAHTLFAIFSLTMIVPLAAACGGKASPSPNNKQAAGQTKRKVQRANGGGTAKHAMKPPKPYSAPPAKVPAGNVAAGARIYVASCQSCHAKGGTGTGGAPRLAKPSGVMAHFKTEPALEVFIAHNMPANNPGILGAKKASDVAAYVWRLAGGK